MQVPLHAVIASSQSGLQNGAIVFGTADDCVKQSVDAAELEHSCLNSVFHVVGLLLNEWPIW